MPPRSAALLFLYLLGLAHWLVFLGFGDIPMGLLDWRSSHFFLSILKEAATDVVVPLHMSEEFFHTDRFLALPDSILSPHVLLLRWLSIPAFLVVHVALMYSAGFLGFLAFTKKHSLSWPGFLAFFLLFNFNGHLVSHYAVGHGTWWGGYFLLPWFFLFVLDWVEREPDYRTVFGMCMVAFGMSLLGSFHVFTWCMIFTGLLGLRRVRWLGYAALTWLLAAGLLAYRIAPALVSFPSLNLVGGQGYPGAGTMARSLLSRELVTHPTINTLGWWEYDIYVGLAGLGVLVCFGVAPLLMRRRFPTADFPFRRLDLALAGMILLSYGEVYWWTLSSLPGLGAERVHTRLLILPVIVLAMLAAVRLTALHRSAGWRPIHTAAAAGVLAILAAGLAAHGWAWRPGVLAGMVPGAGGVPGTPGIANRPDPAYVASLVRGGTVSLLVLAGMIGWRMKRTARRRR